MHRSAGLTVAHAAAACAAVTAGGYLAAHHPLWPVAAVAVFALWVALNLRHPALWLFAVPAALPAANFAPWTGWIAFEEFDLVVLGVLAAGHARMAWREPQAAFRLPARRTMLALGLAATGVIGLWRGVADAGGWSFDWFDGYVEPLNSVRSLKPLVYALLAWPLVHERLRSSGDRAVRLFGAGMLTGLTIVGLAVLWERSAYPGLLNFASPYRTTALFWEMHVGGAAIDGYLALSVPFVAWALWSARTPAQWAFAAGLALLAGYACLTTFSRGVYGAVALPLALLGLWLWARRPSARPPRAPWVVALGAGSTVAVLALFGPRGLAEGALAALALAAGLVVLQRAGWVSWRLAGTLVLAMGLVLEVLAVFGPDSFMRTRLQAVDLDGMDRMQHWREGVRLLRGSGDWLWGLGLGRLPANYARDVPRAEFSGEARLFRRPDGDPAVRIVGPQTDKRLGGQHGLTQRVPGATQYRVAMDIRVEAATQLYVHVCERHLLYDGACRAAFLLVTPREGEWRRIELTLRGQPAQRIARWRAPRSMAFTLSVANPKGRAEIDNIALRGPDGAPLLDNGDFRDGLAHWLPGAQAYYRPWHIDNLYLEALIERGLFGWAVLAMVFALSLRGALGAARRVHHAPFFAASLAGALLLGLVSSLLDVPRVAFLLGLMAALSFESAARSGRNHSASDDSVNRHGRTDVGEHDIGRPPDAR